MQNPQRQPQQKQEQEQPSYRTFDAPKRNNITTDPERGASPDEVEQKRKSFTMTVGRHGLGVILLLFVVVLWTSSNFLASVSRPLSPISIHPIIHSLCAELSPIRWRDLVEC